MKGWRTVLVNAAVGVITFTDWLLGGDLIRQIVTDPADAGLAVAVLTAINLVLRKLTSTPLGSKQ